MATLYGYFVLAIPFFAIFPFVKNKKKFTVIFFLFYGLFVFIEMLACFYYYIYILKK